MELWINKFYNTYVTPPPVSMVKMLWNPSIPCVDGDDVIVPRAIIIFSQAIII